MKLAVLQKGCEFKLRVMKAAGRVSNYVDFNIIVMIDHLHQLTHCCSMLWSAEISSSLFEISTRAEGMSVTS